MSGGGPRPSHRLRSEKPRRELGRRGFESRHLHWIDAKAQVNVTFRARGRCGDAVVTRDATFTREPLRVPVYVFAAHALSAVRARQLAHMW